MSGQNTIFGVNQGDTLVYRIEDIRFSETGDANLAALLGDANRTIIVVIEEINDNKLKYVLGYLNTTYNQTVEINSIQIIGNTALTFPSGGFPIVIPLSTDSYSNYPEYLQATSSALGQLIENLFMTETEIAFPGEINIESQIDQLLEINVNISIQNGTTIDPDIFGISDEINSIFSNLNNISLDNTAIGLRLAYNLTDGSLQHLSFEVTGSINSEQSDVPISLSIEIVRKEIFSLEEIKAHAERFPFIGWSIGIVSITFIIKKMRKKV